MFRATMTVGNLAVIISENRQIMGHKATDHALDVVTRKLEKKEHLRCIFGAAPSQNELLEGLRLNSSIPWQRITAFHMDEYVGLAPDAPQGFGNFLRQRLFDLVPFHDVHLLNGNASDIGKECLRYASLLNEAPIDIVFLGVGENGHIAFNDPPVANFNDPQTVKEVELDKTCRQQQVNDGCFRHIDEVPQTALTLTIPTLFAGATLVCVVPSPTKNKAILQMLRDDISTACPASILRKHSDAILFLDQDSGRGL